MNIEEQIQYKINTKTKPLGSLGQLESIALQIGKIQNTTTPTISKPSLFVFAGDHGIVNSKPVSPFPQEVTSQMVLNFVNGGAAINVFCKQNDIQLTVVDAGVNFDFDTSLPILHKKIAKGTKDYSTTKAISLENYTTTLQTGREIIIKKYAEGCNTIAFGEMGIGNTSSAALLMSYFTQTPIEECVGKGTGWNDEGVTNKIDVLRKCQEQHSNLQTPKEVLQTFGGYEIVMMVGAFLEAAKLNMTIIVDGFIVTSALLAAHAINNSILDNCLFSHCSDENGHAKMLSFLNANPILQLGLRLGEGTGAALAFPLIQSSVNFLNEMASFEDASVSNRE